MGDIHHSRWSDSAAIHVLNPQSPMVTGHAASEVHSRPPRSLAGTSHFWIFASWQFAAALYI